MAKSKMGYALPDAGSRSVWVGASARKRGFDDTVQQSNEEAGQNQPGVFAFKLQGLSFELHNPDAAKENLRPMSVPFSASVTEPPVTSTLEVRAGATSYGR